MTSLINNYFLRNHNSINIKYLKSPVRKGATSGEKDSLLDEIRTPRSLLWFPYFLIKSWRKWPIGVNNSVGVTVTQARLPTETMPMTPPQDKGMTAPTGCQNPSTTRCLLFSAGSLFPRGRPTVGPPMRKTISVPLSITFHRGKATAV